MHSVVSSVNSRRLAYLADIFNHMNEINLSIQGPEVTIMDATEKLQAFLA
jgi:hypothetical protein